MSDGDSSPEPAGSSSKRPRLSSPEPADPDTVYVRSVGTQCSRPLCVSMCVVCEANEVEHVFVPCGHRKVCLDCLLLSSNAACSNETWRKVKYRRGFHDDCKCPICRAVVREVVTLYE